MKRSLSIIVLSFLGSLLLPLHAATPTLSSQATQPQLQQRADFIAARNALRQDQQQRFEQLAQRLLDYPLYPYLEYWDLNRRLGTVSSAEIDAFLERHHDLYLADRLQRRWLERLARQGRWGLFLQYHERGNDAEMECYQRRALYKTGHKSAALDGVERLWLVGRSQPRACDPLFSVWREAGRLTPALAWQRLALAMDNGQTYLARYLERFLDPQQREWSTLWREIHRHPERMIDHPRLQQDSPLVRTLLAHGVRRMARSNPTQAAETWDKLVMEFAFSEADFNTTEAYVALALARKHAPEAMHWLGSISVDNEDIREWRILTAINQNDWENVIAWYHRLPTEEQQSLRWRYWLARAYEQTGKPGRAQLIYAAVAGSRDYYGFLAADRIDAPYDFGDQPLHFSAAELADIGRLPGVIRMREFYLMDDTLNARREWYALIREMNQEDIQKVAKITHDWGWHDRAIHSLGQARYWDDLEIRFPLAHRDNISENASKQQVDPSWAYAVIRQESAFAPDARSPKGAMGLMQIMPSTGRLIARDLNIRLKSKAQLLDVDTNIRFGISYLRKVMNRFDDNTVLATAAYNAGSQRVKSWLPDDRPLAPDRWIENIPFSETRDYLKRVLAYSAIYDERMQRPVTPLKQRMPAIPASAAASF